VMNASAALRPWSRSIRKNFHSARSLGGAQ
jgi:hypothetical protein